MSGVVVDPLRGGRPAAGVAVTVAVAVAGNTRRTVTDSLGRFTLDLSEPGAARLFLSSPSLDSLGIEAVAHDVPGDAPRDGLVIALPAEADIQRRACGEEFAEDRAVVVGRLRTAAGEAVVGKAVWAAWHSVSVDAGAVLNQPMAAIDSTTDEGWFALCGLPIEEPSELRTTARDPGIGIVEFTPRARVQRLDLVVGPRAPSVRLTGRLLLARSDWSVPAARLQGATVRLVDDTTITARTDSTGRFSLSIPRRSSMLEVRSIGSAPQLLAVPIEAFDDGAWEPVLQVAPVRLATTTVLSDRFAREREGFERRRLAGMGKFVTEDQIRAFPIFTPTAFSTMVPGAVSVGSGRFTKILIRGSRPFKCAPLFYEDGILAGRLSEIPEQDALLSRAKRVEVYSASFAPPEFPDFSGCGSVVVWTR